MKDLFKPFSDITKAALNHALAESNETLSDEDITNLMKAYDSLGTFPDVSTALEAIKSDPTIDAYVFSNGSDPMVSTSVNQSPSLAPYASVFKGIVTVQEIQVFKPDPRVYHHLARKVEKTTSKEDLESIWLVSGNPFDIVGARAAGIQAAWIDRKGGHGGNGGWNDRLGELASGGPTLVVSGVDEAVRKIKEWSKEHAGGGDGDDAEGSKSNAALGPG
jgi:2-haloacid dehalogenase